MSTVLFLRIQGANYPSLKNPSQQIFQVHTEIITIPIMKTQMETIYSGSEPIFTAIFLMVISSIFLWSCNGEVTDEGVNIVAHRGAMSDRPENTIVAFQRAHELGADIIEIDLYTSSDGDLFILHDATLDRTTDGEGEATDLTLEELQALDAGSWFGPEYAGERIPSFREVLEWATEEDVVLLLDLKESGPEFADNVAGDVLQYGVEENMVVGVRSPEQAGEFHERLPNARQLAFMGSPDDIEAYAEEGVDVLRLWLRWLDEDPTLADRVRQTGKKLMINGTLGELEEARAIMDFEPDWILIDDVAQLQESLRVIESESNNEIPQTEYLH